jgi:hypothetical protein
VRAGARVSVFTAVPSGTECLVEYGRRADAWEFLDFAISGRASPSFARTATSTGLPVLTVTEGTPPERTCGHPRPPGAAERTALRLQVDARTPGQGSGCPLTVDLYRDSERVIDAVVIYSAVSPD